MGNRSRDLIFTILGIDRGSPAFNKFADTVDKTGSRLDRWGKVSAAALGGTTAAAVAAGVGISAALGGTAVVAGAAGLAIAATNQEVQDSFGDLWNEVVAGSQDAAEPLVGTLLGIREQLGALFTDIQPRLKGLFADSAPAVEAFVDGVDGLVRESLPGLEAAADASRAPMEGVRDLLVDVGRGTTDFFQNVSEGSESSGEIIRDFGSIVRTALGFAGDMLARLANEGAPAVERLDQVFEQLTGTITGLSGGALPVLVGAAGTALNVVSGLLSILGVAPSQVGAVIGVVLALGAALKGLDAVTFGGLSGQLGKVKTAVGEATGFGGKVKAGLSGLTSGFGILGLAAGGLGVMLAALGSRQQAAAEAAAQHEANVEALAEALKESNGVVTASIRLDAAKALQETKVGDSGRNVLTVARELGLALPKLTDGYLGNTNAQKDLNTQLDEMIRTGTNWVQSGQTSVMVQSEQAQSAQALKDTLAGTNGTMADATSRAEELAGATGEVAAKTQEHTTALLRLNEIMLGYADKNLAYRTAVNSESEAHQRAIEAIRDHGTASQEATSANLGWEQSILQSVAAAGALAESQYTGENATERARLKMVAQNQEILRLAQIAGNSAPPALRQMIGSLDATALSALGVKIKVNDAGKAMAVLPDGKEILLNANDLASPGIRGVEQALNRLRDKTVKIRFQTEGAYSSAGGIHFRADGGRVEAGQPYVVGEEGPELIFPDGDGWVATASETDQLLRRAGGSGVAVGGGGVTVINHFNFPRYLGNREELFRELREAVQQKGRGSAERFFAMSPS